MSIGQESRLLTTSDLASLCEVNLKTVHNWADRGFVPCFRTPGRHLRFRPHDVAGFLRSWGYAVPRSIAACGGPNVLAVGEDESVTVAIRDANPSASIQHARDVLEAAILVGIEPITSMVIAASLVRDLPEACAAMVSAVQRAHRVPVCALGNDETGIGIRLGVPFVPVGDAKMLRAAITGVMAEPQPPARKKRATVVSPKRSTKRPSKT